eukprot:1482255-Pyramimonas_sp.AAC.1
MMIALPWASQRDGPLTAFCSRPPDEDAPHDAPLLGDVAGARAQERQQAIGPVPVRAPQRVKGGKEQ